MADISVSVPRRQRDEFWRDAPSGYWFYWFKKRPGAQVGEKIIFRMDRKIVATATIQVIAEPHQAPWANKPRAWKVFWRGMDFEDLRELGEGFKPNIYGTQKPEEEHGD